MEGMCICEKWLDEAKERCEILRQKKSGGLFAVECPSHGHKEIYIGHDSQKKHVLRHARNLINP